MKYSILIALVTGGIVAANTTLAQTVVPPPKPVVSAVGYDAGYHASTLQEGVRQGQASLVEAAGEYNLDTAASLTETERARRLAQENFLRGVEVYFEAARVNRQYRQAARGERPTQEDLIRYSKLRVPNRLHGSQLDPVFGTIYWPDVLQAESFAPYRKRLEEIFQNRDVENVAWVSAEVSQLTDSMEEELKRYVVYLLPNDYVAAKGFIRSLAYEARFAPAVNGVASR